MVLGVPSPSGGERWVSPRGVRTHCQIGRSAPSVGTPSPDGLTQHPCIRGASPLRRRVPGPRVSPQGMLGYHPSPAVG